METDYTVGQGTTNVVRFTADRGDARLRLDQVLLRRVREVARLSRNQVQQWIDAGAVTVDGRVALRPAAHLREGAEVVVALPATAARRKRPGAEERPLDVLYEDACVIALNKPPGVVVHPSYKQTSGTLLNALLWRLRDHAAARPGILTRLDKDTSGVVVVALDAATHAVMQRDASAGLIRKEYLAVVRGVPKPRRGRIVLPLARDPHDRRRIVATAAGAPSETRYEVIASYPDGTLLRGGVRRKQWRSLVRCVLVTGRTHQIRVHLASSGWPILGDRTYGEPDDRIARQALHAWRVRLPHPHSRQEIELAAPLPDDLGRLVPDHASILR